jgi:hypothetical protein
VPKYTAYIEAPLLVPHVNTGLKETAVALFAGESAAGAGTGAVVNDQTADDVDPVALIATTFQ